MLSLVLPSRGIPRRRRRPGRACAGAFAALALGSCLSCTEDVALGRNLGAGGRQSSTVDPAAGAVGYGFEVAGDPDAAAPAEPPSSPDAHGCTPTPCGASLQECGNCVDDDGDGAVDASDPECLGPCDASERELFAGITARVNGSCRADCYFDRNSGSGDDGCSWSFRCDERAVAPDYPPTGLAMCAFDPSLASCEMDTVRQRACEAGCLPLTPNGCDCFGCCELPAGSGHFIWLGSEDRDEAHCELAASMDPSRCRPCTPVAACQNDCQECELCVGKPALPASCSAGDSAALPSCPLGVTPCDPRESGACGPLHYCITGCCVPLPR